MPTINELMVYMKAARLRLNELEQVQQRISLRERWIHDDKERVSEPQYDPKGVEFKIAELNKFLFKADLAIKRANATTEVEITIDIDGLLAPLG